MAGVSLAPNVASMESLLQTLMDRLESQRTERPKLSRVPMQAEIRGLDFWRAVVAECLATFFYVFLICGSFVPWNGHSPPYVGIALAAGFAVASLSLSFAHISGAHLNPCVTLALLMSRKISPIKGLLYVTAQGGGAIAGAALLYGVTSSGLQGWLGATVPAPGLSEWQALAIELSLTFVVVLTHLTALDPIRGYLVNTNLGPGPLTVGLAYATCSLVALPSTGASFNPVRSLGPAFVMNKWDSHWVYWIGPIIGGCLAGLLYEFVFNPYRGTKKRKDSIDGDSLSMHSDEDYDEEKNGRQMAITNFQNARTQHYDQYRPALRSNPVSPAGHMASNAALASRGSRPDRADPIYDGSKSLYSKTPQVVPKAPLNRSQSVYAKPPLPPANPSPPLQSGLAPAQSLYFGKISSSQNHQPHHPLSVPSRNGIHRNESVYGMHRERESPYGAKITDNYGPISPPSTYADQKSAEENYLNSFPAKNGNPGSNMYKPPPERESFERSDSVYTHKPRDTMQYNDSNGNNSGPRLESVYGMQGPGHAITQESIYATKKLEQHSNHHPNMSNSGDNGNYAMYPRSSGASVIRNDSVYGVVPPIRRPTPPVQSQMMNSSNLPVNSPSPADTSKDSAYGSQYGAPMDHELLNRPPSHGSYSINMNKMRGDLISPNSQSRSNPHTPTSTTPYHSPQY